MMIQPSTTHFQHPRQPNQNYAHCVNSYRQNGYQVRKENHCTVKNFYKRIKKLSNKKKRKRRQISQNAIRDGR